MVYRISTDAEQRGVVAEISGKPPRDIIFCTVEPPREYPEIQAQLDAFAASIWGNRGMTPDGTQHRVLLRWAGTAKRMFHGYWVPKYRRTHYRGQFGWQFAGDPRSKIKAERKVFFTETINKDQWPKRWLKYKYPAPVNVTYAWPYAQYVIELWMSPQKASIEWNSFFYGSPEPRHGYHYPILFCGAKVTDANPFGYREPDERDVKVAEQILWEMHNELMSMGVDIDEPMGDSEINHLNYWIAQGIGKYEEEESRVFKEEVGERIRDFFDTNKKTSLTAMLHPEMIHPQGGKITRTVQVFVPHAYEKDDSHVTDETTTVR